MGNCCNEDGPIISVIELHCKQDSNYWQNVVQCHGLRVEHTHTEGSECPAVL